MRLHRHGLLLAACASFGHSAAFAADAPPAGPSPAACQAIADDASRLACYDRRFGRDATPSADTPIPVPPVVDTRAASRAARAAGAGLQPPPAPASPTPLSQFWELDEADKRGTFKVLTYLPNYVLPLNFSSRVNLNPTTPTQVTPEAYPAYRRQEAVVQLSLRVKAAQDLLLPNADLWFTYTHRAQWQVWSGNLSRPFRNTDYEPQALYMVRVPDSLQGLPGGWRWRMVNLSLAHQSNGQSDPLSRSWNRIGVGTAFERGGLSLNAQWFKRLREHDDDNNPDLMSYLGRGELRASWLPGLAITSLTWRTNAQDIGERGSLQFDWSYPVNSSQPQGLRWYVRAFHGHGESLLDYNFRKTSLGAGVMLMAF